MQELLRRLRAAIRRPGAPEIMTLGRLFVLVAGVWVFIQLGNEMQEGETQSFDARILRSLREAGNPAQPIGPAWLPEAARDITALGSGSLLIIFSGSVMGFLCLRRRFHAAIFLLASLLGGTLLDAFFKAFYARPRPTIVPRLTTFDSASFPSGHSMLSAVAYLTIGVVLARLAPGRDVRIYFIGLAAGLTGAVGLSRIYLGVHYPTDVLAGWAAGITWAIFCSLVAGRLLRASFDEVPASEPPASAAQGRLN